MKRILCVCTFFLALLLSGCRGPAANWSDVERLSPVQTLGFDREGGITVVSAAAGADASGRAPSVSAQGGSSIESALSALQNAFPEAEPYYAHVQFLLIGSNAAADGAWPWLGWMEARPEMRLDATVFVARDHAAEIILGSAGEQSGSPEKLKSLETGFKLLGDGYAVSVRKLATALAEHGAGFCGAVTSREPDELLPFEDAASLWPDGFALFADGALAGFIEQPDAVGVLLMLGQATGARIELSNAVVTLEDSSSDIRRKGDTVTVTAHVTATVAESTEKSDIDELETELADYAADQIRRVLQTEQELDADFFALTDGRSPTQTEFSVKVSARINRGYELGG